MSASARTDFENTEETMRATRHLWRYFVAPLAFSQ
jgi:hypothetical protein